VTRDQRKLTQRVISLCW